MSLLAMMLLIVGPATAKATQVLAFDAQPSTLAAGEIPRLTVNLLPASAILPSGTITLTVPSTVSHPVFAATTPRNPSITIRGSGCESFLGRIDHPLGSTRSLVITLPTNCILNKNLLTFDLSSDFLEANPKAGTAVTLHAATSTDSEPQATSYTTVQAKFFQEAVAVIAAPAPAEPSESVSPSPDTSENPSPGAAASHSASPLGANDAGFSSTPEPSDEASSSPSSSLSQGPSKSPSPAASQSPSGIPRPSESATPSPPSSSPSPSPGALQVYALDSTPSQLSINSTFSSIAVYQVPSLNIGDNITVSFTCDGTTAVRTFILLKYLTSNADSQAAACQIPKYNFINCQGFTPSMTCLDSTAAKFQTLATGPGDIVATLVATASPSSSTSSDTSLLYLLFLLLLIPVIGVTAFFLLKKKSLTKDIEAPEYEPDAKPGSPMLVYPTLYPELSDDELPVVEGLPPRVPPPTPASLVAYVPPTPQLFSMGTSPHSVAYSPLPSPYAIPAQIYTPQPRTPLADVTYFAPVYPPCAAPMQQGIYTKKGMDWWDYPAPSEDFSWV